MFEVIKYDSSMKEKWDKFVMEESLNGTFMQTKNFLDYHPEGKFEDCSLLITHKGNTACVIPACVDIQGDKKIFYSHRGSTYGGFIINKKFMCASYFQEILSSFEIHLTQEMFGKILLKQTPELFSMGSTDLIEYMLFLNQYHHYTDLNTYIDYQKYSQDILSNFHYNKRNTIKKMLTQGIDFKELTTSEQISEFYELLKINLTKYTTKPVHTLEELVDFKNFRLKDTVKFFGVCINKKMLSSCMIFEFKNNAFSIAHTQYLASDCTAIYPKHLNPMEYLYYSIIKHYKEQGYKYLSWGISTENRGAVLITGLIKNKESYGSSYSLNKTFYKEL